NRTVRSFSRLLTTTTGDTASTVNNTTGDATSTVNNVAGDTTSTVNNITTSPTPIITTPGSSTSTTTINNASSGDNSGGGGGGGVSIGGFSAVYGGGGDAVDALAAADQTKLAHRCLWILKHPQRYAKRMVDTCWYVARRIPKLAQALGRQQQ